MASKLHGVEVEIKIIKRKGDPIISETDIGENCKHSEQQTAVDKNNRTCNKYNTRNLHVNNSNNNTQVHLEDNSSLNEESKCENCELGHLEVFKIFNFIQFSFHTESIKKTNLHFLKFSSPTT